MARHIQNVHASNSSTFPPLFDPALADPLPLRSHRNRPLIVPNLALFEAALNLSASIRQSVVDQMDDRHEHLQESGGMEVVIASSPSLYTAQGFSTLSALSVSEGGDHSTPLPSLGVTSASALPAYVPISNPANETKLPPNSDHPASSMHSSYQGRRFEGGTLSTSSRTYPRGASFNQGPSTYRPPSATKFELIEILSPFVQERLSCISVPNRNTTRQVNTSVYGRS